MKITSVELLLIDSPLPTNYGKPLSWKPIIVKVNTDEGIYGLGEVGMAYGYGASAGWETEFCGSQSPRGKATPPADTAA